MNQTKVCQELANQGNIHAASHFCLEIGLLSTFHLYIYMQLLHFYRHTACHFFVWPVADFHF